ncbi:1-aminocyclopropane-1-carboxylate oxidase homolog 3-like isoform X2 [Phoenix dactylifera]|uniref:1-aminocyclopropane-1-carboxylate oxidase homolog 3-like isoform X2 n=1 Tax=Phoenix dactylifera TaxID=42345 RepID=A0A8B7CQ03_PHODC|nr:1-aminocyclopropane-1-carboxylate oxidase homolog 3-like isoform X2 [Phoenix dactylifera]
MATAEGYDRLAVLKEFDESKTGVRGLVESGVTTIPPIFRHPDLHPSDASPDLSIPTIDLSLPRPLAVDLIRAASRDWGFFQITNHGVPLPVLDRTISAVRSFHELPPAERSKHYSRSTDGGVSYSSNVDLYRSSAASWRDTIQVMMGPARAEPDRIPAVCRAELVAWDEHVTGVGRALMGMMAEGLGLGPGRLEEMTCLEGRTMVCHYYPPCPEPDLTVGIADHTDPAVLTVLIQDHIGGLQVKRKGEPGEAYWVDVKPLPGALVINVGDLLQMISNDEYNSVEHRVVANSHQEARVSIGVFFNPGKRGESDFYGPLQELVSPEKPACYRNFTISEFMGTFFSKQLASKSLIDHFKL